MKPTWETADGSIKLFLGDALEVRDSFPADASIISDPPYGINHKSGGGTNGKWHNVRHQGVRVSGDDKPFDPGPWLTFKSAILWGANFYSDRLPGCGWLIWDKRPGIEDMEFNRSDSELAYIS